ncbi:hypothetical protein [Marinilactibacillus psychrotolerans]|nr:hypothetical protein [Marinilactibacillus psychrotolerans]
MTKKFDVITLLDIYKAVAIVEEQKLFSSSIEWCNDISKYLYC